MLHATATELKSAKFMGTIKVRLRLNLLSMNRNLSVAVWENKRRHNPVGVDEIVYESTQSLWDWANKSIRFRASIRELLRGNLTSGRGHTSSEVQ
jgi:hypothetical protein